MILALETSSSRGSIALGSTIPGDGDGEGATEIWRAEFPTGRGHGGALFNALEEAMRIVRSAPAAGDLGRGETPGKLEEIIVGLGPGSYSGVRLACAAAAGLALATTGARLGGRASPLALETTVPAFHAIADARRGAFYYTAVQAGRLVRGPELLEPDEIRAQLAAEPGWPVFQTETGPLTGLAEIGGSDPVVCFPVATRLLARRLAADERLPAGAALTPIYLRAPAITLPKAR